MGKNVRGKTPYKLNCWKARARIGAAWLFLLPLLAVTLSAQTLINVEETSLASGWVAHSFVLITKRCLTPLPVLSVVKSPVIWAAPAERRADERNPARKSGGRIAPRDRWPAAWR